MKVVRAKSAHPLSRNRQSAKSVSRLGLDRSMEKSAASVLQSSFLPAIDTKYEKSQQLKERKEILKAFTDKRTNQQQRRKNRELIEKMKHDLETVKNDPEKLARKEKSERLRELRYSSYEKNDGEAKEQFLAKIKKTKENVHKMYLERFPQISNDVRELREKDHKEKYMTNPPLHQRLLKDFEEREERRFKEVKDQLHQLKVQPIDFVVRLR